MLIWECAASYFYGAYLLQSKRPNERVTEHTSTPLNTRINDSCSEYSFHTADTRELNQNDINRTYKILNVLGIRKMGFSNRRPHAHNFVCQSFFLNSTVQGICVKTYLTNMLLFMQLTQQSYEQRDFTSTMTTNNTDFVCRLQPQHGLF